MNIYPGLHVKDAITEREFEVIIFARSYINFKYYVVFRRILGGTVMDYVLPVEEFEKRFNPIVKPFFISE